MKYRTSYGGRLVTAMLMATLLIVAQGFVAPEAAARRRSSTGQTFPTAGYNMTGVGSITWTDPQAALTDNGGAAKASIGALRSATTNYLTVTHFGLAVPTGQTVTSVVVQIKRRTHDSLGSFSSITDNVVSLVKDGVVVGSNKADTSTVWPLSIYQVATYTFSQSDLSGFSTSDFNGTGFGVALSANLSFSDEEEAPIVKAGVDYISVEVFYS